MHLLNVRLNPKVVSRVIGMSMHSAIWTHSILQNMVLRMNAYSYR